MASRSLKEEVVAELDKLGQDKQERVLEYARDLVSASARGTPGRELLRFAGSLSAAAANEINAAVEEDCERVDVAEW